MILTHLFNGKISILPQAEKTIRFIQRNIYLVVFVML